MSLRRTRTQRRRTPGMIISYMRTHASAHIFLRIFTSNALFLATQCCRLIIIMGCGISGLRLQRGRRDRVTPEQVTSQPSNPTVSPLPIQAWTEPENGRPNTYGGDTKPSEKPTTIVEIEEEISTQSNEDDANDRGSLEGQPQKEVITLPECVGEDGRKDLEVYSESNLQSKSMNQMIVAGMKLEETLYLLKSKSATAILTERVEQTKDKEEDDEVTETTSVAREDQNSVITAATGNENETTETIEELGKSTAGHGQVDMTEQTDTMIEEVHPTEDTTSTIEEMSDKRREEVPQTQDQIISTTTTTDKEMKTRETTITSEERTTTTITATETTESGTDTVVDNNNMAANTTEADVEMHTVTETTEDTPTTEASANNEVITTTTLTTTETTSDIHVAESTDEIQMTSKNSESQIVQTATTTTTTTTTTTGEEEVATYNSTDLQIAGGKETDAPPQSCTTSHTDLHSNAVSTTRSKSSLSKTSESTPMIEKIEIDHSTGQSQASLVEAVEKADAQPQSLVTANT